MRTKIIASALFATLFVLRLAAQMTDGPANYNTGPVLVPAAGLSTTTLTTNGTVTIVLGGNVTYQATSQIKLEPGFSATGGGLFHAQIVSATAPAITSANAAIFSIGQACQFMIQATGTVPITYGYSGAFPSWATLDSSTGVISGTPSGPAGSPFSFAVSASNGVGNVSQNFTLTVSGAPVVAAGSASGTAGTLFTYTISATGTPASYNATGLPAGLFVNTSTGVINGTPSDIGSFTVALSATNAYGTGAANLTLTLAQPVNAPVITSANSAAAAVGAPFSYQIAATNAPSSFGASGLPTGLIVNSTSGAIAGTTNAVGTYSCFISASNAAGTGFSPFTITVGSGVGPSIGTEPVDQSSVGIRSVAAGMYHTTTVRQDGAVWSWGYNGYGELGDGTTTNQARPVPALGLGNITLAVAGSYHVAAVTSGGSVWMFGDNQYGQLGDGTTTQRSAPVAISTLSNVIAIACGDSHTIALRNDGTVWAWGLNASGQLGDGTTANRLSPTRVNGLSGIVAIACGHNHSLAVAGDGTIWVWGYNADGELGDGSTTPRTTPEHLTSLANVIGVSAGATHTLALTSDGKVWAWGNNGYGQLGDGTTSNRLSPVQVTGLSGATAIAAGANHSLALLSDATVRAWGYNNHGQLGDGTTTSRPAPVSVIGLAGVAGVTAGSAHSVAVKSDGTVVTWGDDTYGQLGDGGSADHSSFVQAAGLTDAVFSLGGIGSSSPAYQWQSMTPGQTTFTNLVNDSTFAGVNTSSLRVQDPSAAMTGTQYRCLVTDGTGTAVSTAANLVVAPPVFEIIGGNNQTAQVGQFNAAPFDVALWNGAGTQPLMGASVTFTVQSGGGLLATTNSGLGATNPILAVTTDIDGTTRVYYQQPATGGITSQIAATTNGVPSLLFQTKSLATVPAGDSDHNGLPDAWEMRYFGRIGVDPNADPDGDGLTNLQEFLLGTDPTNPADGKIPLNLQLILATPSGRYYGVESDWSIVPVAGP